MLSAKTIFEEIFDNDEAFRLFCSIAAAGEAQGGWENGRIAALVPASCQDLAPKIARHGADEDKHGRIFTALLRKRGLQPVPVPADTDYTMRLEGIGLGVAHSQLRRDEKLSERDILAYLAHSRVTEQRTSEQMRALRKYANSGQDIARAVTMISRDEDNHLAYCHEELFRLAADGVPAGAGPAQRPRRPAAKAAGPGAVGVTPTRSREPTARPGLPPCPGCSGRR